jgi:hypothetical protein
VTDEVGDAAGGADIIAVTTSTTPDDELVFEIELAGDWPEPTTNVLRVRLSPDRNGTCNPWVTTYVLDVAGGGEAPTATATLRYEPFTGFVRWWGSPGRTTPATYDIEFAIDGPRMTLAVPLDYLADPRTVGFRLFTPLDGFPSGWYAGAGGAFETACDEIAIAPGDAEQGPP